MQEIEFELVHRRRRTHRPMRVERYEVRDPSHQMVEHIYQHRYNGTGEWAWNWGGWGFVQPRVSLYGAGESEAWAYVITFRDGSQGVCRVQHINAALAELGARVNMRGDT